jgi:predicted TIM-barrel fold metal-dependent hydrolase
MILAHGVEKILWATDYPALSHRDGIAEARTLDLTEDQFELIFHKNAERLFGVTL